MFDRTKPWVRSFCSLVRMGTMGLCMAGCSVLGEDDDDDEDLDQTISTSRDDVRDRDSEDYNRDGRYDPDRDGIPLKGELEREKAGIPRNAELVARGEGMLGALTQSGGEGTGDAKLGDALSDLRQAMADLRAITGRIEAGEGTLGGLLQDPTVYENLAAFLEGAQRSVLLRALIRAAIGRGTPAPDSAPAPGAGSPRP